MTARKPWGFTIFCDDIRHEVDGKRSFIGVYANAISLSGEFPIVIPKFSFATTFYEPHDLAVLRAHEVSVHFIMPGEGFDNPSYKAIIPVPPPDILENIRAAPKINDEGEALFSRLDFNLSIVGMTVKESGWLRIRASYNDEIVRLGSLQVIASPPAATS